MLRHTQTIRGSNGDCFRTALACFLDMEKVEDVPHFFDGDPNLDEGWAAVREWLLCKGLFMLTVPFQGELAAIMECMKVQNPGIFYLISGYSGIDNHIVVAYEDRIIHDPCGKPAGNNSLVGPCTDGFYWIKFLLPRFHGVAS